MEDRISAVIGAYPSKTTAARAAGVTVEQLGRYVKGANRASFDTIFRLCAPFGVSLDWVATGRPPEQAIAPQKTDNTERYEILLGNLIAGLEQYKLRHGVTLPPSMQARLVVLFFRLLSRRLETGGAEADDMERKGLMQPETPLDITADHDLADILTLVIPSTT